MKNLKLLAALLALTIGLAGCGGSSKGSSASSSKPEKMLDGDNMIASSSAKQEYTEPEDVTYMRLLAGEDEYRACVLYLGGSYEVTTDVQKVLDSLTDPRGFVGDVEHDVGDAFGVKGHGDRDFADAGGLGGIRARLVDAGGSRTSGRSGERGAARNARAKECATGERLVHEKTPQ